MNLVMPSTLYLQSWMMTLGFDTETTSISPPASSWWKIGRFLMQTLIFNWSAEMCCSKQKVKLGNEVNNECDTSLSLEETYRLHHRDILLLLLNHGLEVDIYLDAEGLVVCFPLTPFLLYVVHTTAPLLTVNLEFFNFIEAGRLLGECAASLPAHVVHPCSHIALVGASSRTTTNSGCCILVEATCYAACVLIISWHTYNQPLVIQSSNVLMVPNQKQDHQSCLKLLRNSLSIVRQLIM